KCSTWWLASARLTNVTAWTPAPKAHSMGTSTLSEPFEIRTVGPLRNWNRKSGERVFVGARKKAEASGWSAVRRRAMACPVDDWRESSAGWQEAQTAAPT